MERADRALASQGSKHCADNAGGQVLNDYIAQTLLASDAMKAAKQRVFERYFVPRFHGVREGSEAAAYVALDEMAVAAMLDAAEQDALFPRVTWFAAPPLNFSNQQVPGSRFAFDNPDRIYRHFAVDSRYSYRLRGRLSVEKRPLGFTLEAQAGEGPVGWGRPYAALLLNERLTTDEDGCFEVTIGSEGDLPIREGTHHVWIRDTLYDWTNEEPTSLRVERTDGPSATFKNLSVLEERAVGIFKSYAAWQFGWTDNGIPNEGNQIFEPVVRPTDDGMPPWGMTAGGSFDIDDDRAVIITLDPQGAQYLGLMLSDPWFLSIDYQNYFSSLNNHQVDANADGTITYVLAAKDPGIKNWLETGDVNRGTMLIRWEHFAADPTPRDAVKEVRQVRFEEIAAALPPGMTEMSPSARERARMERQNAVAQRFRLLRGC